MDDVFNLSRDIRPVTSDPSEEKTPVVSFPQRPTGSDQSRPTMAARPYHPGLVCISTDEELDELLKSVSPAGVGGAGTGNGSAGHAPVERPTIVVIPGMLPVAVDDAEKALIRAGVGLYRRGTRIVKPTKLTIKISNGRETTAQCLADVTPHRLAEELGRAAIWVRPSAEGKFVKIDCPGIVARTYLARAGQWNLPVLTGITNCPTLREDGSLLEKPGYDADTGILYDPQGSTFPPVAVNPSRQDARDALSTLRELLATFPFSSNADLSVALSAILTAMIRRTLGSAPMHGFTAPVAGSGKSMLVDIAAIIATGHEAAVIEEGDEEELPKRLGAALLAGNQVISIDNIERRALGGGFLCQALTQPFLNVRILGHSELRVVVPDSFLCATGNNLRFAGDMSRRTILCTLDPGCERPELREFAFDPIDLVKAQRPRFVHAGLTILRAYCVAGRPQKVSATGSFESWSRLVRAALVWLGEKDPLMTTEAVRGGDPRLETLAAVIEQWRTVIGARPVTVRELIDLATKTHQAGGYLAEKELHYPDFREALLAVAGRGGAINGQALGNWLGRNRGRIIGRLKIERHGVCQGNAKWQLMNA